MLIVECVIPDRVGGWTAREIALIDGAGDLLVMGNLSGIAKSILDKGAGGELLFRMLFTVTNATTITFNIDPAIASRGWSGSGLDGTTFAVPPKPDPLYVILIQIDLHPFASCAVD